MSTAILVNGKEIDYSGLPDGLRGGMGRYLEYGVMPGHFLSAILANDLRGACGRPYDVNRRFLFEIVQWLFNHAPADSWGSEDKVSVWRRERRIAKTEDTQS